jgi:hypothetical protein
MKMMMTMKVRSLSSTPPDLSFYSAVKFSPARRFRNLRSRHDRLGDLDEPLALAAGDFLQMLKSGRFVQTRRPHQHPFGAFDRRALMPTSPSPSTTESYWPPFARIDRDRRRAADYSARDVWS